MTRSKGYWALAVLILIMALDDLLDVRQHFLGQQVLSFAKLLSTASGVVIWSVLAVFLLRKPTSIFDSGTKR